MQENTSHLNPVLVATQEKFLSLNMAQMAHAAGVKYFPEQKTIESIFLGQPCTVSCTDGSVESNYYSALMNDLHHQWLVLNNLVIATGRKPTGNLINARDVKGSGTAAIAGLHGISSAGMEKMFGADPKSIYKVLEYMPGAKASLGDASVRIEVLARVPITFVVWAGEDDIIPPAVNFLFDSTVCDYLLCKDIPVILGTTIDQIVHIASLF